MATRWILTENHSGMTDNHWTWSSAREIPSRKGAGAAIVQEILEQLRQHNWIEGDIFGVHLALEEALVNAIKHGNGYDVAKKVRVHCRMSTSKIRIEIRDEGRGFEPGTVPDPTEDENLEVPSGRGILLMRSFMTAVQYNTLGNQVVMEKIRES